MNKWEQRVKDHSLWAVLEDFGPVLDRAANLDSLNDDCRADVARLKSILELVGKRLAATDSILIAEAPLNFLDNQFKQANSFVISFLEDLNAQHLHDANTALDAVLQNLGQIGVPSTSDDLGPLRTAAADYRAELERQRSNTIKAVTEVTSSYGKLQLEYKAATESVLKSADSLTQQVQSQLSSLSSDVAATKARADTVIGDLQSKFLQAQSDWLTQFANAQEARQNEFASYQSTWHSALASIRNQMNSDRAELKEAEAAKSKAILDEMESRREQIEQLVGVIGNLGMTSGFQKEATAAKIQTLVWQWMTVGSILFLIIWLVTAVLIPPVSHSMVHANGSETTQAITSLNWFGLATRILVAAAFGVLSRYSATQADRYLAIQRANRKLELELQALGPYLAPLPIEKQQEFRLGLAKKIFGRQDNQYASNLKRSPATLIDVLATEETRELAEKIVPLLKEPEIAKALVEAIGMLKAQSK